MRNYVRCSTDIDSAATANNPPPLPSPTLSLTGQVGSALGDVHLFLNKGSPVEPIFSTEGYLLTGDCYVIAM